MQDNVNVRRHKTLVVYELNVPHKVHSSSTGRRCNIAVSGLKDERIVGYFDEDLVVCNRESAPAVGDVQVINTFRPEMTVAGAGIWLGVTAA